MNIKTTDLVMGAVVFYLLLFNKIYTLTTKFSTSFAEWAAAAFSNSG
jgi:hypothetical protein